MYANETGKYNETGYELSLSTEQQHALTNFNMNGDQDEKQRMIDNNMQLIVSMHGNIPIAA